MKQSNNYYQVCQCDICQANDFNTCKGDKMSKQKDDRPFPIQGGYNWYKDKLDRPIIHYPPCTIPWWLAEEAYKVYSNKFGTSQSLKRLAERGGFGREELVWLLEQSTIKL